MKKLLVIIAAAVLTACGNKIPETFRESGELPRIYPDYTNVTVPINIAPLAFQADGKADGIVARLTAGEEEVVCGGTKVQPDADDWKRLARSAKGKAIKVEVYIQADNQWTRFKPFNIYVSPDSIDPYISYRLIAPSYENYKDLTISQRCLENYDERVVYDNILCMEPTKGQCINCHNYQQYNPNRMQFHARQHQGGTVIAYDGKIRKIDMRNDSILSAGVYPTWHPWLPLIVYSTNLTVQTFHVTNPDKIEVYDTGSDLIAYDVERNEVTNIENAPTEFECFPFWAPDGKTLYYCSAHFEYQDTIDHGIELIQRFREVKYNLYKKSFDPATLQFGPRELVFDAAAIDKSATLPRVSPDGRYLMFTLGKYGVFHIWHRDADLWMIDLSASPENNGESITGNARPMKEINSPHVESYHSWSGNGRWVVFSSRRYDGNYTRPFFAHIDKNGHASKPFELPCADPDYHRQFMRSYNIPEFMRGPVIISPQEFADVLKRDGEPVKYVRQLNK
jgi:hypothetical protein